MKTWRERNADSKQRGHYTRIDQELAGNWNTCAIGEQRALHPDVIEIVREAYQPLPTDLVLQDLGGKDPNVGFAWAVEHNDPDAADLILDQIEDRVLQLKREKG